MTGGTPKGRYPKSELAFSAGVNPRTYHRYLRGEHLPTDEEGIERIILMAQNVGMERQEAESYLPDAIEEQVDAEPFLSSEPVSKVMGDLLREVHSNGEHLRDIQPKLDSIEHWLEIIAQRIAENGGRLPGLPDPPSLSN